MAKPTEGIEDKVEDELATSRRTDQQSAIVLAAFNASLSFWMMAWNPLSYIPRYESD